MIHLAEKKEFPRTRTTPIKKENIFSSQTAFNNKRKKNVYII